jgi:Type II CAAX prenyl endopeptidase Rce1-like
MEDQLRVLVCLGLGMLLVLLRFDAERFGAAEYDEIVDGQAPPLRGRLAWYVLGVGLVAAVMLIHPDPAGSLGLGLGDRSQAILLGFLFGAIGTAQALGFAWFRYRRLRFPAASSYPDALLNSVLTAFIDEATFRGLLLGLLVGTGLEPWVAVVIQTIVYALATRTGAPGRVPYMLGLSIAIGLLGGWLTLATGGIGAAFIGHAITRFSVFLATGHAGQVAPRGTEVEEVWKRRLVPEGWRVIGTRDAREATPRDR